MMNVSGVGRVSKAEVKTSQGGKRYIRINVGVSCRKRVDGQYTTTWDNGSLTVFQGVDFLAKLQKGDRVQFSGTPEFSVWDKDDGAVATFSIPFATVEPIDKIGDRLAPVAHSPSDYDGPPSGGGGFDDDQIPFMRLDDRCY